MMPARFVRIESGEQIDELFERSHQEPVALLKHSNRCGTSFDILEQMEAIDGDVNVVHIQEHRALSAEIARRTGYRHQSPQAFVIVDGRAVYHATHYGIDAADIQKHLSSRAAASKIE
jgi:bacillithiol system protein YtxJ